MSGRRLLLCCALVAGAACSNRGALPNGAGAAASPAPARASVALAPGSAPARATASAAPAASAAALEPPTLPDSLRAACPLELGERPLRIHAATGEAAELAELVLTERRLCARHVATGRAETRLDLPLHRLLRMRLATDAGGRASLVLYDLDFADWTLPLGRVEAPAASELLEALTGAWRPARAAFARPPMPPRPFTLAAPDSGPRHPEGPGRPRYDHAVKLARAGQLDGAFYWLVEAALTEGVGVKRSSAEPALARLRGDPRWPALRAFFVAAAEAWAFSSPHQDPMYWPRARAADAEVPVALYLHGIHSRGKLSEGEQRLADELGVALVAVDATLPSGEGRFRWTENAELDLARLEAALARHAAELGRAPRPLLLYAFSQGAMAAGELALRYPERFAGAWLMSPGFATELELDGLAATPAHARLLVRCDAAAGEAASTVKTTRRLCATAERLGARTTLRLVEDATEHRVPKDFREVFRAFTTQALAAAKGSP